MIVPGEELIDELMCVADYQKAKLDLGEHASSDQPAEINEHELGFVRGDVVQL